MLQISNYRIGFLVAVMLFAAVLGGCHRHQHHKHYPPGHVQHRTGYNPASGKFHPHAKPGRHHDTHVHTHDHDRDKKKQRR